MSRIRNAQRVKLHIFLSLIITCIALMSFSCSKQAKVVNIDTRFARAVEQILEMKKIYLPLDYTKPGSNELQRGKIIYSYQLDSAIVKTGGKPILFLGVLDDIIGNDTNQILRFRNHWDTPLPETVIFNLTYDGEIHKITGALNDNDYVAGFALVAVIEHVSKAIIKLKAESEQYDEDGIESYIEADFPSLYLASGKLLDAVYVPNLYDYVDSIE